MKYPLLALIILAAGCNSQRFFIVRHAERAIVTKDSAGFTPANPPLSEAGKVRAFVLRDELRNKKIRHVFSTNYHRTIATAQPLIDELGNVPLQLYSPSKDSLDAFIEKLKSIKKGSVVIVGHSNTVDDVANKLSGSTTNVPGDLKDTDYDNLFIVERKGKKWSFHQKKYGYPSAPEGKNPIMDMQKN